MFEPFGNKTETKKPTPSTFLTSRTVPQQVHSSTPTSALLNHLVSKLPPFAPQAIRF
jgi:hypothetical protein